jgi:hypothetical protein
VAERPHGDSVRGVKKRPQHTVHSQRGKEGAKQRGFGASGEANVNMVLQSKSMRWGSGLKSTLSVTSQAFFIASNMITNIINITTTNTNTSNAIIISSSTMKSSWRTTTDRPPSNNNAIHFVSKDRALGNTLVCAGSICISRQSYKT